MTQIAKDCLEKALNDFHKSNSIRILNYSVERAVPSGDNYTSDTFRVQVTYATGRNGDRESVSLIVKRPPIDRKGTLQLVTEIRLFEKELEMFSKTLPAIYNLLGKDSTLSSNLIYCASQPETIIMFDDLTTRGFRMFDRRQGFDLEHCLLVVKKIATLHAASIILYEKDPTYVENYGEGLFSNNSTIVKWVDVGFEAIAKACLTWPGYEKYSDKLQALRKTVSTKGVDVAKARPGQFSVLNHGDCWVNNFMFSYEPDGKLKDMRFVDYQLVIYSSPAIDLQYFWATSPKIEVRREHFYTIFNRYYAELLHKLAKFNYSLDKVPTRKAFLEDWKCRSIYGLIAAATVLPIVKASPRNDASFESILEDDSREGFRYHMYNNDRFRKHMEYMLEFYEDLGALD